MPVVAAIQFTQGVVSAPAGQALATNTLGTAVVVSNGDNTNVAWWTYELIDVPGGSAVPLGAIGGPSLPVASFTPDVRGSYCVRLTVIGQDGSSAVDVRVFAVYELSGRLIPPFHASAGAVNVGNQLRGWAPYLEQYLKAVDGTTGSASVTVAGANVTLVDSQYSQRFVDLIGTPGATRTIFFPSPTSNGQYVEHTVRNSTANAQTISCAGAGGGATQSLGAGKVATFGFKYVSGSGGTLVADVVRVSPDV